MSEQSEWRANKMTESRLYPSKVLSMISGVAYITGSGTETTLHYTDGTTETGNYDPAKHGTDFLNIVSAIQSQNMTYDRRKRIT